MLALLRRRRNPDADSPPEAGLPPGETVRYPRALERLFEGRRFMPLDPPQLLDYPGAQVLMSGACEDVKEELGIDLDPQRETERTAAVFRHLHLVRSELKVEPLLEGKWQ